MRTYRLIWWTGSTLLALLGAAAAILLWSAPATLVIFGCAAAVIASITAGMALAEDTPPPRRELVAAVTTKTMFGAIATVALFGLGAVFGVAVIVVVLLVAASSPPAVAFCLGHVGSPAGRGPGSAPDRETVETLRPAPTRNRQAASRPAVVPIESEPDDLDDVELCRAWRRSYWALQDASSPAERLRIVEARQAYLDKLERRHPGGLASWFESGARPGGDPSTFLARDSDRSHRPE